MHRLSLVKTVVHWGKRHWKHPHQGHTNNPSHHISENKQENHTKHCCVCLAVHIIIFCISLLREQSWVTMDLNLKILTSSDMVTSRCLVPMLPMWWYLWVGIYYQKLHIKTIYNSTSSCYVAATKTPSMVCVHIFCVRLNCCSPENSALQVLPATFSSSALTTTAVTDHYTPCEWQINDYKMYSLYRNTITYLTSACLFHTIKFCLCSQRPLWWNIWNRWWKSLSHKEITNLTPFFFNRTNWIQLKVLFNVCKKGQIYFLDLSVTGALW